MARTWFSWARNLLFAPDAPENRLLPRWAKYALPLLLFAITRLATIAVFDYRGVDEADSHGYVAIAEYISAHGHIPDEHNIIYRQFPGLPMLMVAVNFFIHNMWATGYLIVTLSAIAAICLVQYLFDDFRLTIIFVFFFPWWITTTSLVLSEAPGDLCVLLALWGMRDAPRWSPLYILGLFAGGYAVIIRHTAMFLILPFITVYAWRQNGGSLRSAAGAASVALLPFVLYLSWNWLSIHQLFPQAELQREETLAIRATTPDPSRYSTSMLEFPGESLCEGLMDPSRQLGKKLMIVSALGITLIALARLLYLAVTEAASADGALATAFAAGVAVYTAFHLCIGGRSGFQELDRYLSELIVMMTWGLLHRLPLRWPWIAVLCAGFLLYAMLTEEGTRSLGFIK